MIQEIEQPNTEAKALPDPGLHYDMPDTVYHSMPMCSKHALDTLMDQSPLHMKYQRENPKEPTPAMKFGSALHCAILTPEIFKSEWKVLDVCRAVKADGKRCSNVGKFGGFCGVHNKSSLAEDRSVLTPDEFEHIQRITEAVYRHTAARELLSADGNNEVSAFWNEQIYLGPGEEWKLWCKARADIVRPTWEAIADIKTCEDASADACQRSIDSFNYHRQAAHYLDGFEQFDSRIKKFIFIFVEKTAPYGVRACMLLNDAIDLGREEVARAKRTYAACERSNHWYGYEHEFTDTTLPPWSFRRRATSL